jgi:hypothetical protein
LSEVEGAALSEVEGAALSEVEGAALSEVEGYQYFYNSPFAESHVTQLTT